MEDSVIFKSSWIEYVLKVSKNSQFTSHGLEKYMLMPQNVTEGNLSLNEIIYKV